VVRCVNMLYPPLLFSSAYTHRLIKATSSLAVINKVHWCAAIVASVCCDKLYLTVETVDYTRPVIDHRARYWSKIVVFDRFNACCQRRHRQMLYTGTLDRGKLVTLIAGSSKRRSLLIARNARQTVYDKRPQRYAEDNITVFNCTQW